MTKNFTHKAFGYVLILLAISGTHAFGQKNSARPLDDSLLSKMVGAWGITSHISSPGKPPIEIKGKSTFIWAYKNYLEESFEIYFHGDTLRGKTIFRYESAYKRYSMTQIDDYSPSALFMLGENLENGKQLSFHRVAGLSAWQLPDTVKIDWIYSFDTNGTFKKILNLFDDKGKPIQQSDFIYSKR